MTTLCPSCFTENPPATRLCSACGTVLTAPPEMQLPIGTLLDRGKYLLEGLLGRGGFGITYLAIDQTLNRRVAIKEFFPEGSVRDGEDHCIFPAHLRADCEVAIEKFLQEGLLLARLRHPGVVGVFDTFCANQTAYMVMEFVAGTTLQTLVDENHAPLPEDQVVPYIRQVAEALVAIHDQGLLHRDIKPENIMVTPEQRAVLIDFGAARVFELGQSLQQSVVLTPGYAPLEQYASKVRLGPYTDLYALAGTLYFALTWEHPTAATDRISGVQLDAPRTRNPKISPIIERAILWGMAQRVEERPQNAQAFIKSLLGTARPTQAPRTRSTQVPTLEISNLPARLLLEATVTGETLRHPITLTNPGVGTLQGKWEIRNEAKDTQAWLRVSPATFKGNRSEFTLVANTELLRGGQTYRRWLELYTNGEEGNRQFEVVIEVAANNFVAQQLQKVSRQLLAPLLIPALVGGALWGFFGGGIPNEVFAPLVETVPLVVRGIGFLLALLIGGVVLLAAQARGYESNVGIAYGCVTTVVMGIGVTGFAGWFSEQFTLNPQPWGNGLIYSLALGIGTGTLLLAFLLLVLKPQYERQLRQRQQRFIEP